MAAHKEGYDFFFEGLELKQQFGGGLSDYVPLEVGIEVLLGWSSKVDEFVLPTELGDEGGL